MFNNLGNLADLMRNAGKLRESVEKATEALGQLQVEGTAGGGAGPPANAGTDKTAAAAMTVNANRAFFIV